MEKKDTTPLNQKKCTPCEEGGLPLPSKEVNTLKEQLSLVWECDDSEKTMKRTFSFSTFSDAVSFIQTVAEIAESEGHHPDIFLHDYNNVDILLSTHAIGGLSENDFILASKIERYTL